MDLKNFEVSWVDIAVPLVLLIGIARGRRRGMSEELLDVFKWLIVVAVAGHFYEPIANVLSAHSVFSLLTCNLFAYSFLALLVIFTVSLCRRRLGQKLIGSDVFGGGEYYLGMMGGFIRYACVVIVVLSFINARYYTPEEIRQATQYQQKELGSEFIPSLGKVRREIVENSWTGRTVTEYLSAVMIRPTSPSEKPLVHRGNIVKARERQVKEVLEDKPALDQP